MLLCEGCQGSKFTNAGIGDQHIDLSLSFHGLVESIEVLQFGDVSPNARNLAADRLYGFVEFLLAAARYEDVGTFVDEALRRGETYSRGAAGNHRHLSLQLAHNRHFFFSDEACRRNACGPDRPAPKIEGLLSSVDVERLLGRRASGRCLRPYPGRSGRKGRGRRSRYGVLPAGSAARGADGRAATVPGRRHRWLHR